MTYVIALIVAVLGVAGVRWVWVTLNEPGGDDCLSAAEFKRLEGGVLAVERIEHWLKCGVCRELSKLRK